MLIKNGLVFMDQGIFQPMTVLTDGGRISMLLPPEAMIKYSGEAVDARGCYVLPGLTDIHFHGCRGFDLCDGTPEALEEIARYQYSQGVTSICPAAMTLPEEDLTGILTAAVDYYSSPQQPRTADLVGIHLEGPFLSPEKRGAQKAEYLQAPSPEKLERWLKAGRGLLKLMTIAPELDGAIDLISRFRDRLRFSLGHTAAGYDTALRAFRAGADHLTHMYNAMPPFSHREPGPIGAAFDTPGAYAELICDGVHLSPSAVRAAFAMFGPDRIILISDSMEAAGMPDGEYRLGGQSVRVSGPRATISDGTLAGSVTPLYRCLVKAVSMGIPLEDAVKAATINPCRSIGIDRDYGSISVGKRAHLLLADKESLELRAVYSQ